MRLPPIKTKGRDGREYTMNVGGKASGPSLLDALGKLVAFRPSDAKQYLAEHPDEARKVKDLLGSAWLVLDVLGAGAAPVQGAKAAQLDLTTAVRDLNRILSEGGQVAAWLAGLPGTSRHDLRRGVEELMVKLDDVLDLFGIM
jgi:hypothetical protein